jgi:hypothetical protein
VQPVEQTQFPELLQSALHVPAAHPESAQFPVLEQASAQSWVQVATQFPVVPGAQTTSQPPPSQENTQFDIAPRHCMVQPPPGQSKTQLPLTVQSHGAPATQVMKLLP